MSLRLFRLSYEYKAKEGHTSEIIYSGKFIPFKVPHPLFHLPFRLVNLAFHRLVSDLKDLLAVSFQSFHGSLRLAYLHPHRHQACPSLPCLHQGRHHPRHYRGLMKSHLNYQ